ncbi:hypothetical protein ACIPWF_15200 [Paenarthrobacter sp. NPDC089989]|uniref:hypothetical protein n=1 Tax=unclassified Paenarthrobacter TaxID=2634190 RepID=UPI0037F1BC11
MDALTSLALTAVFGAIFLYLLYFVVRSGVRDGILQADQRRAARDHQEHQGSQR